MTIETVHVTTDSHSPIEADRNLSLAIAAHDPLSELWGVYETDLEQYIRLAS